MGITERKQRERLEREKHFVSVARELFLERGYEATSIEEVATAAEFSKRAVYLYFDDKRELFLAVVLRSLEALYQVIAEADEAQTLGLERVLGIARAYFGFSQTHSEDFQLILDFEASEYHLHRDRGSLGIFAAQCVAVNDRNTDLLLAAIEQGQEDGSIRRDVRPVEMMLVTWAQAIGLIQVMHMRSEHLSNAEYQSSPQQLFELALDTLKRSLSSE